MTGPAMAAPATSGLSSIGAARERAFQALLLAVEMLDAPLEGGQFKGYAAAEARGCSWRKLRADIGEAVLLGWLCVVRPAAPGLCGAYRVTPEGRAALEAEARRLRVLAQRMGPIDGAGVDER